MAQSHNATMRQRSAPAGDCSQIPHGRAEVQVVTHDVAGSIAFRERTAVKTDSGTIQIAVRVIFIVRLCHCGIVLLWDCTIVQLYHCTIEEFHNPAIPQSLNPTFSQFHILTILTILPAH